MDTPAQILSTTIAQGRKKVDRAMLEKAALGFVGGAMISIGYLLYVRVASSIAESLPSVASLVGASVFPIGLIVILMGGGELITSNMAAVSAGLYAKKVNLAELSGNWAVITVFNLIGAFFVAFVFGHVVGLTAADPYKAEVIRVAAVKISANWYQCVLSGIGCNWLVGLAMWLCYGAKDAAGKVLAIWFPVMTFVAVGFQHSVANAFIIPAAIFEGGATWAQFWMNFIFVYIGNILGGALFVAGIYTVGFKREMNGKG